MRYIVKRNFREVGAAIGMATINSLVEIDENSCIELNAAELIIEKGKGKRIAVVGYFPFMPRVRKYSKDVWVIEKNPKEGAFSEAEADNLISQADVVAITGTALTNHTLEHLLDLCHPRAYVIILGDTASCPQSCLTTEWMPCLEQKWLILTLLFDV